jgi:3-oxoacyl-[acyl-carrier-protein] synthase-3
MRPLVFNDAYITATGRFLPGPPVTNAMIDGYVRPINQHSDRIKRRILAENGIRTRHYAIDPEGETMFSTARMGAEAVQDCLAGSPIGLDAVSMLCTGTSGGDVIFPGFANMLQGELGASPLTTSSHHGICAAGMAALTHAAMAVDKNAHDHALVVASEFSSRMFKSTRFAPADYRVDFDAHFLRWMLSDGAGAWLVGRNPAGAALRIKWIHLRSFSGDYPTCMQLGGPATPGAKGWADHASFADADRAGAILVRQDIRLLPHLFDVGFNEYVALVRGGWLDPERIDHFLCHYSSERFAPVVADLLDKAGLAIARQRWFSNLAWRGNTGAAAIFIMLADFLRERSVRPGEQILLYIPESGRFTVSFVLLEAVDPAAAASPPADMVAPPIDPHGVDRKPLADLLQHLSEIWHDYRSRAWRTPMIARIVRDEFNVAHYRRWMAQWIPQVREGAAWMRAAAANLDPRYATLKALIEAHASDEQSDYAMLYDDYRRAGGEAALETLTRNPGGEALHAFLCAAAATPNPIGLLGAIYVIEGTGQRIVPALLPAMKRQLGLTDAFRFLSYHGANDTAHLDRWLAAVSIALDASPDRRAACDAIVAAAQRTAQLYLMQLEMTG